MSRPSIRNAALAAIIFVRVVAAQAQDLATPDSTRDVPATLPAAVPPSLRAAIVRQGVRVEFGELDLGMLWPRKDPFPTQEREPSGSPVLADRAEYRRIPKAAFLGVVHLTSPVRDYRDREISAGTYTMRYAIQPAFKEHRGVSKYRDFAILTPIGADAVLERTIEQAVAASTAAFGRGHPTVLALFPVSETVAPPAIIQNELGQGMLAIKIGGIVVGIVFQGHGQT